MTVAELIANLKLCPPDAQVRAVDPGAVGGDYAESAEVLREGNEVFIAGRPARRPRRPPPDAQ